MALTEAPSSIASETSTALSQQESRPDHDPLAEACLPEKLKSHEDHDPNIRCEYLTFETELPWLNSVPTTTDVPSPPNFKKYDSPFNWSSNRKTLCLAISCAVTFMSAFSAPAYSIAAEQLRPRWGLSQVAFNTGVTTWAMGFACSPMFLAPLSEINGRRPVFISSGIVFLAALIGCAGTESFAGMLVARFFVGAGASTFATMVGGVISDVYHARDRNTPMAIYSASALAGTGAGPVVMGFVVDRVYWRWVFWAQVFALAPIVLVVILFFKETRGSVLLSRKAKMINKHLDQLQQHYQSNDKKNLPAHLKMRFVVAADENRASLQRMLYLSLTTPFKFLATEPVVFFFSLWAAFAWAVLYMTFSVIPLVFTTRYDFTTSQNGAVFSAISIGTIIGCILSIFPEKWASKRYPKMHATPEGRLYFACLSSCLLPIGLFWFGWTSFSSIHWIVPVLSLGCAQMGIFAIYLAFFNYLADVYHRYASSALAAQSFCRNVLGAVFPLFTDIMFRRIGFAPASSLLGGLSALLTLVPWVLVFYGVRIRARSKVASEIMQHGS